LTEIRLPDLSKEVASTLTTQFGSYFTCKHNSNVVYPIDQLNTAQVDCWPAGLVLTQKTRAGLSGDYTLNIAIQQRAPNQETVDILTNLATDVLRYMILKRWLSSALYSSDGSFVGAEVFDRFVKYEENVFQSVIEVNFKEIP